MARPYVRRVTTTLLGWASTGFVAGVLLSSFVHVQLTAKIVPVAARAIDPERADIRL